MSQNALEAIREEVSRSDGPLLVIGSYGSGKAWLVRDVLGDQIVNMNAAYLKVSDFTQGLQDKTGPVMLDELHKLPVELVSQMRHFLATSRHVVCLAPDKEQIAPELLSLFHRSVQVGKCK